MNKENQPSRKEWMILGGICGLGFFYYVLIRWVILEKFCSPEIIKAFTKVHASSKFSIMRVSVAFLTIGTLVVIYLIKEYLKQKKEGDE